MSGLQLLLGGLGAVLFLVLALCAREAWRVLSAQAPQQVRQQLVGTAAEPIGASIPKVIWTYWQTEPVPDLIAACMDNWRRYAPDHELRMLSRNSLHQWFPAEQLHEHFETLPAYRQADWLRLQLLARHGGIWMDASTILSQGLDWVHKTQQADRSEYVGFYLNGLSTRPELPLVENWFMASVPGSAFVQAWVVALDRALKLGADAILDELRSQGRFERVVQGLSPDFQRYLLMHVAVSDLLDRDSQRYRLALIRAEDSAYALHMALGWRKRHLYARLALTPCPARLPCLIKLRGPDRRTLEQGLARRPYSSSSAIARLLYPNQP